MTFFIPSDTICNVIQTILFSGLITLTISMNSHEFHLQQICTSMIGSDVRKNGNKMQDSKQTCRKDLGFIKKASEFILNDPTRLPTELCNVYV